MPQRLLAMALLVLCLLFPSAASGDTRALLVACSEFLTQPPLGSEISGNLHMIGSALIGADPSLAALSIEDGTIGSRAALQAAVSGAFSSAQENDLSLLYLCTHGVLSSADDGQSYLLLGDGESEDMLSADDLFSMLSGIQGEKLLILDACYSGALIGRPASSAGSSSDAAYDPSIHVLTSAANTEASWYYDSDALEHGAQSYFASAFAAGLGLYDSPEADASGDRLVSLAEMHRYLTLAVPSSSAQLLSAAPQRLILPSARQPMLERPLSGFSFGSSLLLTDDPVFEFSFTAVKETAVQYRLVEYMDGRWNWAGAKTFLDGGDDGRGLIAPGRRRRALSLEEIGSGESGYLMLQVFSLSGEEMQLCAEQLIAVQPADSGSGLRVSAGSRLATGEYPIFVETGVPAEITVSIRDGEGQLISRLCSSQLTRPNADNQTVLYWDAPAQDGLPAAGLTVTAEAVIGGERRKASCPLVVTPEESLPPDA